MATAVHPTPTSGLAILIAEDNELLGEIMVNLFRRAGHHAEHLIDGALAWERLAHASFDVVVTDHHMPGLSGLELARRLRAARFAGRIVVHSSSLTAEIAQRYQEIGICVLVPKTSRPDALLAAITG